MRLLFLMMGVVAILNGMGVFLAGVLAWQAGRIHALLRGALKRHDEREDARARTHDDTHKKIVVAGQKALDEEAEHREETLRTLKAIHHATEEIVEQLETLALHEPAAEVAAPLPELPVLDAQKPTAPASDEVEPDDVAAPLPELRMLNAPRPAEPAAEAGEGDDDDNAETVVMDKPQMAALLAATTEEQSRTTPAEPAVLRVSSRPAPPPPARPSQPTLAGLAPPSAGHTMLPAHPHDSRAPGS